MKYRNQERIDQEDAELLALEAEYSKQITGEVPENPDLTPLDPPSDLPVVNKEEETWKKRHGDLRSYTSKQINDLTKEIDNLKKVVADKEREATKLPTNKAEAEAWIKEYPDLARVISTVIETQTEHIKEDVKTTRQELEAERLAIAREKALNAIIKVHPDFLELVNDEDFKEWVESQPAKRGPRIGQALFDALYNNNDDADSAIQAVNVYKSDKSSKTPKKDTSALEAATSVRRTSASAPSGDSGKRTYTESEIEKMDYRTYEKLEEDIDLARREGRYVYDITGAAR